MFFISMIFCMIFCKIFDVRNDFGYVCFQNLYNFFFRDIMKNLLVLYCESKMTHDTHAFPSSCIFLKLQNFFIDLSIRETFDEIAIENFRNISFPYFV